MDQKSDIERYLNDDTVFNAINKTFVSLQESDTKESNIHLQTVVNELLRMMSEEDTYFKRVYQRILFGGSYYKRTKVGHPEEFDLDIIIKLPINYNFIKIKSCQPGFVEIYSGLKPDDQTIHREMKKLLDQNMYLDQEKFRCWMESILNKTIKKLPGRDGCRLLRTNIKQYNIKLTKSGPAFTLHIVVSSDKVICVDLVPVLELSHGLPNISHDLRYFQKRNWFAVPKPLDRLFISDERKHLYWRTCFYQQEKEILSRHGKIKPVLRQIKKLRDTQNWKHMASYYIETLFLLVLQYSTNLETKSCTFLFMMMLEKLQIALSNKCIPYYWNQSFNLLSGLKPAEIMNIEGRLRKIILSVHKSIERDRFIIASYILNPEELQILKDKLSKEVSDVQESSDIQEVSKSWGCILQ